MTSNLSAFAFIPERAPAVPALWNDIFSTLSANIAAVGSNASFSSPSSDTISISTNLEVVGGGHFQYLSVGSTPPSYSTTAAVTIEVNSAYSDYFYLVDSAAQKSSYVIGSRAGGLADGLNIWDASAGTMIASFSKQSIRFFQNVVGPVFDVGGALASTLNAATFGTGADSRESRIQAAVNQASIDAIARVYVPASMYPYSASSVSFIHAVQMVREGGDWSVYDVIAYGANSRGTGNSTAAVRAAITAAGNDPVGFGQKVVAPQGSYVLDSTLTMSKDRVILEGAGKASSIFYFVPAATADCIRIASTTSVPIKRCEVRGIGFQSSATNTATKTAIHVIEGSETVLEDISTVIGTWVNGSIGVYWQARDLLTLRNVALSCDRPLVIGKGQLTWIDSDHCRVEDFYGLCTVNSAGTVVEIVDGANVTNLTFDGQQAWVGGQSGFGWNDSTTTLVGYNLHFSNVRYEQGNNPNGWGVYLKHTAGMQHVTFDNCYFSHPAQGVYFRGVPWVMFNNCTYSGSTNTGLDVDNTVKQLMFNNCFWQVGSTISTTTMVERWRLSKDQVASPLPDTGLLDRAGVINVPVILGADLQLTQSGAISTPDGNVLAPSYAFSSETSLGWYRSKSSFMALSNGALALNDGSSTTAALVFRDSTTSLGIRRVTASSGDYLGIQAEGVDAAYIGGLGGVIRAAQVGSAIRPSYTFNSEASLGVFRSGVSTLAMSYGTLNLATQAVRLSMRTLATSSVTASAVNTNVARDEVVFTVGGASGASLIISSGGTAYIFNSAASAILA